MNLSSKIKVAVLRGGPSNGYDDSLKSGKFVLSTLREMDDVYEPLDIFISKGGEWHRDGLVHDPHEALKYSDVVWNALPGSHGEDGQIERLLQSLQIPFTGSNAVASTLSVNREMTKRLYRDHLLRSPAHELVTKESLNSGQLFTIFRNYLLPVVVKPATRLTHGLKGENEKPRIYLAHSLRELEAVITDILRYTPRVMIEESIRGEEVSCLVIEGARGENIYALIPVSKSLNKLPLEESRKIEEMAKKAHEILGLRHYSSSDFVISPKRNIYILETNSLPPLHEDSPAYQSLLSTGWRHRDFVEHILKLAM